jgi:hypothetical protein
MNRLQQLQSLINSLESEFQKFYEKGNSAAGTRLRAGMQEIKKLSQEIRIEVTKKKKG